MKILFAVRNDGADAYFRAVAPASMLRFQGVECEARSVSLEDAAEYDILVLQRHCSVESELLTIEFHAHGKKVVYDVDDWLPGIPPFWPAYDDYFERGEMKPKAALIIHERLLRQADVVTCTVPALAEKMLAYNKQVRIVPNCIMWADWDTVLPTQKKVDGPVVGWFGLPYYWDTWRAITPVLEETIREIDGYLSILGYPEIVTMFSPWLRSRTFVEPMVRWKDFRQFRSLIQTFDVGLAWMEATPFNLCKSPLKVLQYGAAGVPIIASGAVYGDVLSGSYAGEYGALARSPADLNYLIKDALAKPDPWQLRAKAWRDRVWAKHTYETQWPRWMEVFREVLD